MGEKSPPVVLSALRVRKQGLVPEQSPVQVLSL